MWWWLNAQLKTIFDWCIPI